jgi:argininosuccinate lyase
MSNSVDARERLAASAHQMWGGRFTAGPADAMAALNNSLPIDHRLWQQDLRASKAWVNALAGAGVVTANEEEVLLMGLERVEERIADGAAIGADDEDIHTLVERLLYEEVGAVAGKLHTGRSRNDQVATDLRLWCLDAIEAVDRELAGLIRVLATRAREGVDFVLPGYTHGQQAQPVRWGYVLLAHAWPLVRDRDRLSDVRHRVAELPLGSGAVAGSGVPVDRVLLKEALGFHSVSPNALDATGDRDFVAEIVFALSLIGTHLSRLGTELVTYSSTEYGFVKLNDAYSTGSSLLPQKRNPDVFELARAKAARTLGNLVALMSTMRALPAGYSKDLQEDKPQLFDAVDTVLLTLPAIRGAVETLEPVPERMQNALRDTLLATDIADMLVQRAVPFREAHGLVGSLVRIAEKSGHALREVPAQVAAQIHPAMPAILAELGDYKDSVDRRVTAGGTSATSVMAQIAEIERRLHMSPTE